MPTDIILSADDTLAYSGDGYSFKQYSYDLYGRLTEFKDAKDRTTYYTVTSIEAIQATGRLVAVKDGPTHVSVRPYSQGELIEWIESRSYAEESPHSLTVLLQSISIKP